MKTLLFGLFLLTSVTSFAPALESAVIGSIDLNTPGPNVHQSNESNS
jgi:hypothetical protein